MRDLGDVQVAPRQIFRPGLEETRAGKAADVPDMRNLMHGRTSCTWSGDYDKAAAGVIAAPTCSQALMHLANCFRPDVFDRNLRCPVDDDVGEKMALSSRKNVFRANDLANQRFVGPRHANKRPPPA